METTLSRSAELKRRIAEIDALRSDGTLTSDAALAARDKLEAELLAQVMGDDGGAPPAAAATTRPSGRLVLGLLAAVLVFGAAGYAWLGNRAGLGVGPGQIAAAETAPVGLAQIEAMTERLAKRLKEQPDDAEGWAMLGRSYGVLGRPADAVPAYRRSLELRPKDAQVLADLADALGTANSRSLEGEPARLVARALEADPANTKALLLAGTLAFDRTDAAGAARYWASALKQIDPASDLGKQVQSALDEARQKAGLPAAGAPASAAVAAAGANAGSTSNASVRGRISLAAALEALAAPDDTVFVFARAVQGGKMPLAILRRQVKDLPLDFALDDSLAMSPAARISGAGQVIVGARISKSGNAMPQPGDLQGLSAPVAVGASGVNIEIAERVR